MKRIPQQDKFRAAERLFDALDMIDDRIVFEAQEAYKAPSRSSSLSFRKYVVSAMVAMVLVVSMIGGFVISNLTKKNDVDLNENVGTTDIGSEQQMDMLLLAAAQVGAVESTPIEEIDFFDGNVSLIWSYEGDTNYYKLIFDTSDAEIKIKNQMSAPKKEITDTSADLLCCKVWISYGNGEVVSPYLKASNGNIGYSTLFDYSPEVIPSEAFTDLVHDTVVDSLDS